MKRELISFEKISRFADAAGGVFSYAELSNIVASGSPVTNSRVIKRLVKEGVLIKIQRGIYVTKSFELTVLSSRIVPASYISMDRALAFHGLIGTVPAGAVSAVCAGIRPKRIKTPKGDIIYCSISRELFFGFERQRNGVAIANPEKAFLDTLYFYTKGKRFVIDPLKEINIDKLNKKVLETYLKRYKNPKFINFVKRIVYEK